MNELHGPSSKDTHDDASTNLSRNPSIHDVLAVRFSRRQTLLSGLGAATTAILGGGLLSACSDNGNDEGEPTPPVTPPLELGFTAVAKSLADAVVVPAGYTARPLYRLGDPLVAGLAAYANDGTDANADQRAGDHHDGMSYFGLSATGTRDSASSTRGLLVLNHENITQSYLHPVAPTPAPRPEAEAFKEISCHGVSVIEVASSATGLAYVQASGFNRRITPFTEIALSGPVAGSRFAVTRYSPGATRTRGTINNCANGYTPWGTYLTCEENWNGYFARASDDNARRSTAELALLSRYGLSQGARGNYQWATVVPADASNTAYARWNASVLGSSSTGSDDFRNEPNTFGYIVEIDPYAPASTPVKRTALGRFAHEGCWPAPAVAGQPVVFYMGDDSRGEYVYKFVSDALWDAADANAGLAAGAKYLDRGTLYVARFKADGSGEWVALVHGSNGLSEDNALFPFTSQAAVLVATRLAADSVGATKMDRPEWTAVNPKSGEVYVTLTNNSNRGSTSQPVDAANPRSYDAVTDGNADLDGNVNGHILRWKEASDDHAATTFEWDVYLFGARASAPDTVNLSDLDDSNDLSSPDGLWFSRSSGLLWIQTDDGAYTDTTNCMMLAAVAGAVGDGDSVEVVSGTSTVTTYVGAKPGTHLRRFLVGPKECEITGLAETPDGKALFVNIQHPGENGSPAAVTSHFPDGGTTRPRSTTLVITRNDGGVIGIA